MNKINKLTKNSRRLTHTENILTAIIGEEVRGLSEKDEGIKQEKGNHRH